MKHPLFLVAPLVLIATACSALDPIPTWTDPEAAAAEFPDFLLQGEYTGEIEGAAVGLQAAAMEEGNFLVTTWAGGLPGDGWTGELIASVVASRDELNESIAEMERVERESPTLGQKAPEGATVLFAGEANDNIKGKVEDGLLWAGSSSTVPTGSFKLHLEYRLPFKPGRKPSSQDRGNSGVYIFNSYECQVLDSFALPMSVEEVPYEAQSAATQWCSCFYKMKQPDVPMVFPPLRWQTLDIEFTAPVLEGDKKVTNARVTIHHNGVLVHDDFELETGTGAGAKRPEKEKGLIHLQGHGNPVAYRNLWIVEK